MQEVNSMAVSLGAWWWGNENRNGAPQEAGREGRRGVARQLPGAEERNLEGGGTLKSAPLCRGWLSLARTNRPKRLVTPSWQPAVHPELLPAIINIQEVSSAQNSRGSAANRLHGGWGAIPK